MQNRDVIARCVVGDGAARVVVAITTDFAREAARRHRAGVAAALAMARAGTAGLLLATLTKGGERVTLQLLGGGPLGALTVDAASDGTARVFVGRPDLSHLITADARPSLGGAVGRAGIVSVVRDLGLRDTFRGQTPFVDGEIDTDVERYLNDSEQIDSALGCDVWANAAGGIALSVGILVQSLPGGLGTEIVAAARERLRSGQATAALDTARATAGLESPTDPRAIAAAALGPDVASLVQLGAGQPVRFHCPCSRDRAAATLAMLGQRELVSMIEEDGHGQVTCEFCRNCYAFTDQDLDAIRRRLDPSAAPPS